MDFKVILILLLCLGLVLFFAQPVEKRDGLEKKYLGGIGLSIKKFFDKSLVEGILLDDEGDEVNVLFHGKPIRQFDCMADVDCLDVDSCDNGCSCDSSSGQCFTLI